MLDGLGEKHADHADGMKAQGQNTRQRSKTHGRHKAAAKRLRK
jgi:hypothetical protein